jgi:cobalamin biosynthesis protein CobD/CbiB
VTDGPLPILLVFFLLHFITGLFLPSARYGGPLLFVILKNAGIETDRRLNRDTRAPGDLFLRGTLVVCILATLGGLLGHIVKSAGTGPYGWAITLAFLACVAGAMQPLNLLRRFAKNDDFAVARRALELSALSLCTWFTGPLFWFAVLGAPGAALYVTFAALREAFGDDDAAHAFFGMPVRLLDRMFNFIPALLTAMILALAAVFVSRASPARALDTASRARLRDMPAAALAGALGVTLGGPPRAWIGPKGSSAKVTAEDVGRGAMIHFVFFLCAMAIVSAGVFAARLL